MLPSARRTLVRYQPAGRLSLAPSRSFSQRRGSQLPQRRGGSGAQMTREEVDRIAQNARDQERWTNILIPERSLTIYSPATWLLAFAVVGVGYYNHVNRIESEKAAIEKAKTDRQQVAIRNKMGECKRLMDISDVLCKPYQLGGHCHDEQCVASIKALHDAAEKCAATEGYPDRSFTHNAMAACQ